MTGLSSSSRSAAVSELVDQHRPDMAPFEELYRQIHANPELSLEEGRTADTVAENLRRLPDFEVKSHIGGTGVVGIFRNGAGKTILLRAELDALPLQEQTGLTYASTKWAIDPFDNVRKPVMHACGHDMHMTSLLAAAKLLHTCRRSWAGTLVVLFQPNEERGAGAQAMVDDGLYAADRHAVPVPDVVLGGHVMAGRAGSLRTRPGVYNSTADSFIATLYGKGGHGSRPHQTIDPAVLASSVVMKLQTIVSRETDPQDPAVVTVGAMHVGSTENVISDEAVLRLNTRAFTSKTQAQIKAAIERIIHGECMASGCTRPPTIARTSSFPLLYNDERATGIISTVMEHHFGTEFDPNAPASMGSEDIGNLATPVSAALCFWSYGGTDPKLLHELKQSGRNESDVPGIHSSTFAPVIQPTLKTAIDAYAVAALAFLI